ncbi:hypothetical protein [Asticcacaulis sp.]|uniref:hypothetical protein n=1 Tax=Asticcacaulis sp. TaxID=1872648 RepID=UPI003919C5D7
MLKPTGLALMALLTLTACGKPDKPAASGDASSTASQSATEKGAQPLSCEGPVGKSATAAQLLQTYAGKAREETVPGPEGTTESAIVLYPDDPARKVVVTFWDEAKTQVADVRIGRGAVQWYGPGNIRIGSPLKAVEAANGKGFDLYGFDWDYGGYAADFKGGTLGLMPGDCVLGLRFAPPEGQPGQLTSDIVGDTQVASSNPNMQALQPVIVEMSIGWPSPAAAVQ